jgi:hypothetical protein
MERTITMKRTSIAFLCFALMSVAASAQQRIALREGIVVDPTQPVAYVMTPQRGVAAVDMRTGATLWTSNAAAKPLAISGNRLVSQVEPNSATNRLELVALDVQRGERAVGNATDLPAGVRVSVGETLAGTFMSTARTESGSVVVTWSYLPRVVSGMSPEAGRETDRVTASVPRRVGPIIGGVRMNPMTGAMTRIATQAMIPAASSTIAGRATNEIIATPLKGTQYESADGRHVLLSERVADDREWEKYRWTVFERQTGRKIGETRSHVSFAPFVVRDLTLVFQTTPYRLGKNEEQPARLRGVSLDSGRETWSVPVREVVYRGPMPP